MLTNQQQSAARYDGGKAIANRKRHLAQVKSALISLCAEIEAGTNPAALTTTEVAALRTAARLVAGIETAYAKDASEAKRIQTEYEARVKLAASTVRALVHDRIADTIALYAIAFPSQSDRRALDDLGADTARSPASWTWRVDDLLRAAVSELSWRIVHKGGVPPAAWCAALDLRAERDRHAALIARIKACVVADRIQEAA